MRQKTRCIYLVFIALLSGCGTDDLTQPNGGGPSPAASLALTVEVPDGTSPGDAVDILVQAFDADGTEVAVPAGLSVQISADVPYFTGYATGTVEDAAAGPALRLLWPGSLELTATTGGLTSPVFPLEFAPVVPIVRGFDGASLVRVDPGATVALSGYRLDLLADGPLVGETPVEIVERTPETLRFLVPEAPTPVENACSVEALVALDVGAALVLDEAPRLLYGDGAPVDLEAGGYAFLGASPECLLFPATSASSAYTLFYVDGRPVREAETTYEYENHRWQNEPLTVHIGPPGATAASTTSDGAGWVSEEPSHVVRLASAAETGSNYLLSIDRPLVQGEAVTLSVDGGYTIEDGHVLKIYPGTQGSIALVGLDADGAAGAVGRSFQWDADYQAIASGGLPIIARAYSDDFPRNLLMQQLVVVVRNTPDIPRGVALFTSANRPEDRPTGFILLEHQNLDLMNGGGRSWGAVIVAHETAHAAQVAYEHELCATNEEACEWAGDRWAVEGGANFVAHEVTRTLNGFRFDVNIRPASRALDGTLLLRGWGPGTYEFAAGYFGSEWLMRDLLQRLIDRGYDYDTALGLVARGAYEPWYGWMRYGYFDDVEMEVAFGKKQPVPGLVPAMRALFGQEWDPIEALLLGGVSQAVDDRTTNPELQNVTQGDAWELYSGPFAELDLGAAEPVAYEVASRGWTYGWAEVSVPAAGGVVNIGASAEDIHWVVVRTK